MDQSWRGPLHGTAAAYEVMTRQGFGHVVNIGSIAGHRAYEGGGGYVAAKHALAAVTERIVSRSAPTRSAYLDLINRQRDVVAAPRHRA